MIVNLLKPSVWFTILLFFDNLYIDINNHKEKKNLKFKHG